MTTTAKSIFRITTLCLLMAVRLSSLAAQDIAVFPQLGHSECVNSVMYSPDGRRIVSGSDDGTIKIWDVNNGKELRTLSGHKGGVGSAKYSPDGKYIVSGSVEIKIWDAQTGKELRTLSGHTKDVNSVMYSPDGKRIVSGSSDNAIKIWDAETGKELRTLSGHTNTITSVTFSPDGKRIVSGSYDGTIKIWDAETGKELRTLSGHTDLVMSVLYSPDGKYIVSGSHDKTIKIWDADTGKELRTLSGDKGGVSSLAFSPDGKNIVSGTNYWNISIWNIDSGKELLSFSPDVLWIGSVCYSTDGKCIVSAPKTYENNNRAVRIWNAQTGRELMKLGGFTDEINSVAYSPNGKLIASGYGSESDADDYTVRIWNIENGQEVMTLSGHTEMITSVTFSPDGKRIMSGSRDEKIKIWDAQNGNELLTIPIITKYTEYSGSTSTTYYQSFISSLIYSPDGKRIAAGLWNVKAIKIWDAQTSKELRTLSGHKGGVRSITFSPDGKRIASGASDKTIKIWDVQTSKELRTLSGHTDEVRSVNYSPDGKRIVSGASDKTIKIWDAETGRELMTLSGHANTVRSVAFSPDGKRIVSGSFDNTIKIWDANKGKEIRTISGHTAWVNSVMYSPDGKRIVSGSSDNTTRVWDAVTGKELIQFIAFVGKDNQLASASRGLTVETETASSVIKGEWLSITSDGYYTASPRGDRYINMRVGNTVSGIDAYRSVFYNPDVVEARLQGKPDPKNKAKATIQQAIAFIPPEVAIQSPSNGSATNTETTNLSVNITSQSQPIKNIKIIVNGRLIGKDELSAVKGANLQTQKASLTVTGNQKTVNLSLPLELDPGNNRIEVVAFNGYSENRRYIDVTRNAPAGEKPALPNLWIVAVGVNVYDNAETTKLQGMKSLNCAVADAKGLVDSLKAQEGKRYGKVNAMLIADGEAQAPTTDNIKQGLKFLEGANPRRDVVILFLAGHGISAQEGKFFFLPKDAVFSGNRIVDTSKAISGDEIMTVLDTPGNRLVFIDACNSGSVDNDRMVRSLMDTNAFVFTASRGYENSFEDPKLGHGYFTYSIMSALKGAPAALAQGSVSVLSMSGYVKDDVPKKTGGRQNPSAYSLGFYDFPVAEIK